MLSKPALSWDMGFLLWPRGAGVALAHLPGELAPACCAQPCEKLWQTAAVGRARINTRVSRSSLKDVALAWLPRNDKILETTRALLGFPAKLVFPAGTSISPCVLSLAPAAASGQVPWAQSTWDTQTLAGWLRGTVGTAWERYKGDQHALQHREMQGVSGPRQKN